ncbi:NRPS6, nonribosomal peptide synthase [Pyrenochaeta sp. DS3sAY3a]|nr:NRPS6, nonribosomal peptide synthase [Pyrenochaeta sp. DS3sAY3a]
MGRISVDINRIAPDHFDWAFKTSSLMPQESIVLLNNRDETILLSWLIVLMQSREGSQFQFEWAYQQGENDEQDGARALLLKDAVPGMQSSIGQCIEAISEHITTIPSHQLVPPSNSKGLLLSTSFLSESSENLQHEGQLHLEIRFNGGQFGIRPVWNNHHMSQYEIRRHVDTLFDTIRRCISNPNASIEYSLRPTTRDLDDIWGWNSILPPSYDFCMHEMISQRAQEFPDKEAISAWDGCLTYAQVDQYSTSVAHLLKENGVEPHDVLPVCFEKSKWTIVAVLAVMKVGATLALSDPSLPLARLQNMATQVGAKTMLTSRKQFEFSRSMLPDGQLVVVEAEIFKNFSGSQVLPPLDTVSPSTIMYIIFTSGSTGTPKGVKISHGTYTSSAIPRAEAVGYTKDSRVLDFASYAFDVSIDSMLLTLGNGGCLCIPSDEERMGDINGVMRRMQVNYAGLTPSVARILEPDVIESLSGLGLGGEAASARDVNLWGQVTRIIIGYGPCECTIGCTINSSAATGEDYISIGKGNGAAIWIVDPNDHDSLMPVGAVGELLVEGPIVGQGYLGDPEKTAAAFIEDPPWLSTGHKDHIGRRGRLYKTGDLGKYDPDGSGGIVFAGRKDTQVKLRGQRVELGEIESQLTAMLPKDTTVIAEVITPAESGGQPTLVVFVAVRSTQAHGVSDEIQLEPLSATLREALFQADSELSNVLPRYMVPTAYIPVNHLPVLISGKTDRKCLRQFGSTVNLRQLDSDSTKKAGRDLIQHEQQLRQVWAQTLNLDPESIQLNDNFFAIGGDSLAAMRLVSACREQGLSLTVANTFSHPTLSEMSAATSLCSLETTTQTPPFSLIQQDVEAARIEASQVCGLGLTEIEDIYPCTPTQESLFTFSIKSAQAYIAQRLACIPTHIELDAWKKAWEEVAAANPILRTRLAQLQEPGLQQVVVKENISWKHSESLDQYLIDDQNDRMDVGKSLARYAIVDNLNDGKRYMVWTVHHVVYDGWSEPLILQQVSDALQHQTVKQQPVMRDFVKYVKDTDEAALRDFWRIELEDAVGPQFPRLPSRNYLPIPDASVEHQIQFDQATGSAFTVATIIRAAWAFVSSRYTGSNDVVFGETLMGRDIAVPGIESIIGPLIATVPVRVRIDGTLSVQAYLQAVQKVMSARTPYQHMGMQNIRKVSQDAQHACEAGTGLVIQPEPEYVGDELGFVAGDVVAEALHFNPYPLMVAFGVRKTGIKVVANFDSSLVEPAQMKRMLAQLEHVYLQFSKSMSTKINDISCIPEAELCQIWNWNQTAPLGLEQSSGRLHAVASVQQGSPYPPAAVSWVCDPQNPSLLAPIGAVGELWIESALHPESIVDSPAWLVAGSSTHVGRNGKVHSTGDIVRLQGDGRLVFVGRKEDVLPAQGHAVDLPMLEAYIKPLLPEAVRAAAAILQSSSAKQELVVFVEQLAAEQNDFELIPGDIDLESTSRGIMTTIRAKISSSLAELLRKLQKSIEDSLPPYMIPSAYVVVDKMPYISDQIEHEALNELAAKIPSSVLVQLRESFQNGWARALAQMHLSQTERVLQSAWADNLGLKCEEIDVDDNFFRLGGDSVLAMKLVSALRAQGHQLTVADIFRNMRLGDLAKVLQLNQSSQRETRAYEPFSTIDRSSLESYLSETIQPKLVNTHWTIQDVLPVTDSQALDIRGTVNAPRTSVQYTMLYFQERIDQERLFTACDDLVKTHEILRTVFIEHKSTFLQVVVDQINAPVTFQLTDMEVEQYVTDFCASDIESSFNLGSQFFKIVLVEGRNGQQCLVLGLSHALYDGGSLPALLRDLEALYSDKNVPKQVPFGPYIAHVSTGIMQTEAIKYWRNLLGGSSISTINGTSSQAGDKSVFRSQPVTLASRPAEITTANLLTATWALILARRLQRLDVTFGGITTGRNISYPDIEDVMGPCYQFTPIRVAFQPHWTSDDLLHYVQKQSVDSAAYDFLGFSRISTECTEWPSETRFFDSLVHHQDFEEFDTMPFAGGSCKVDISNPHGDAAYPLKAVSFVQGGQMHVGFVGSERDLAFVETTLEELVTTIQELSASPLVPISQLLRCT